MNDFVGDHNPVNYLIDKTAQTLPDPSLFQVKNMVAEYVGIPLGNDFAQEKLDKKNWFLFYGPMGSGKTMMVRALQNETNSLVFDITPDNVKENYPEKSSLVNLIWSVIICAK